MMTYPKCQRIIGTAPGRHTAETMYQTEDGRWWTDTPFANIDYTTGREVGYLHGNNVCSHSNSTSTGSR